MLADNFSSSNYKNNNNIVYISWIIIFCVTKINILWINKKKLKIAAVKESYNSLVSCVLRLKLVIYNRIKYL